MIAHQWKQPLNNLNLLNQMLKLKYKKNTLDQKVMEYFFDNSTKQITLMSKTVDNFRDFFKIDEEKEDFDIQEIIHHIISITQPLYKESQINILFRPLEETYKIHNYKSMLFQIIINILNNARDALLEAENKKRTIYINLQQDNHKTIIQIADNAGGIPQDIIDKIFDPYFSTKKEKNGAGLGLYMAKTIIEERMQGEISVENTEQGALFSIKLS